MKKQEFEEKLVNRQLSRVEENYVVSFSAYSEAICEQLADLFKKETARNTAADKVELFSRKYLPYRNMCYEIYDILNGFLEKELNDQQMKRIFTVLKGCFENIHTISDEYEKYTKLATAIHVVHTSNINTKSFCKNQVLKKVNA